MLSIKSGDLLFQRGKNILQVHYSVLTLVMFRSANTIQWQWDGYKVTARMLSCYMPCVKGNGAWGTRWFRAVIEKEEIVYQEEIIVFSSLRLPCLVWGMKNQGKDLTRGEFGLFCSIHSPTSGTAKIWECGFVHCTVTEQSFSSSPNVFWFRKVL